MEFKWQDPNGYPYIAFYCHEDKQWKQSNTDEYMYVKWWSYIPKTPDS